MDFMYLTGNLLIGPVPDWILKKGEGIFLQKLVWKFTRQQLVDVNGNNAAPVYKFLKSSKGGIFGDGVKWNFAKFLVDKDGHVVDRYAPTTSPLSIEKHIKKLLGVS